MRNRSKNVENGLKLCQREGIGKHRLYINECNITNSDVRRHGIKTFAEYNDMFLDQQIESDERKEMLENSRGLGYIDLWLRYIRQESPYRGDDTLVYVNLTSLRTHALDKLFNHQIELIGELIPHTSKTWFEPIEGSKNFTMESSVRSNVENANEKIKHLNNIGFKFQDKVHEEFGNHDWEEEGVWFEEEGPDEQGSIFLNIVYSDRTILEQIRIAHFPEDVIVLKNENIQDEFNIWLNQKKIEMKERFLKELANDFR